MIPSLDEVPFRRRMDNAAYFQHLFQNAHREISKHACKMLVERLRMFVQRVVDAADLIAPPVWGWSGGKESVVLEYVLRPFDWRAVCVLTHLELPQTERFIARHLPKKSDIVTTRHDLIWLRDNPEFLFPRTEAARTEYKRQTVTEPLERYAKDYEAGMLITGRRRANGDSVPGVVYVGERSVRSFAPLLELSTAEIWAIIRHFDLPINPLYNQLMSSLVRGTGGWPTLVSWEVMRACDPRFYEEIRPFFEK